MMTNDDFAAIKRDYDRDGFVILRGFVKGKELDELRDRATKLSSELFERQSRGEDIHGVGRRPGSPPKESSRLTELSGKHSERAKFRNVVKNLQAHDSWFGRELNAGRHVPLIRALVEDELVPATAAWFSKRARTTDEILPHRDAIGRPQGPHAGATIWIAIDPADPENGCLHYGRGSHKMERTPGIFVKGYDVDDGTAVPATVQPGDAVIHNALTVHWSEGNPTDRTRRAVSFFYWTAANKDWMEKKLSKWNIEAKEAERS